MSTTVERERTSGHGLWTEDRARGARRLVGGFYLVTGGINAGIVAAGPQTYETFADGSFWPWVTRAWHDIVMAQPYFWFVLLAAGEVVLGLLLLRGGRAARAGWVGVIAFHVLLMSFGLGVWLWCVPALAFLVPAARADWPALAARRGAAVRTSPRRPPRPVHPASGSTRRTPAMVWSTLVLATSVLAASLYGLLADAPYRSLPEATILGAQAQDACSIVVAVLLVALTARPVLGTRTALVRLGLLGYLLYSYLIYVSGVPMNRMFLVYVAIVALAGAGLATGLVGLLRRPAASSATRRLWTFTGWFLIGTAALFAGLWLSVLLPVALDGGPPQTQGVGGTPYPVFWLDLALVLPAVAAVGTLLVRRRPVGPPLAVVALIKIVTLFTALWAGPLVALATGQDVHLGPDAGPSVALLVVSTWLAARWLRSFRNEAAQG